MTRAALDQFNDRPVKRRFRRADEMWTSGGSLAPISGSTERGVCRRMRPRAGSSNFESVVIRNGILTRHRVHRVDRSAAFQGHHLLIAHHGVGGPLGAGGSKGWGKVTRSGLLGTPDLVLSRLNVISRRRLDQPCGAISFRHPCRSVFADQYLPIISARSARDPRAMPPRSNPTARANRRAATMSRRPRPSARSASPSA